MDPSIVVKLVGQVIFWVGFVIILSMLKSFIAFGVSIGVATFLNGNKDGIQRRMCNWFSNGDDILEELQLQRGKTEE